MAVSGAASLVSLSAVSKWLAATPFSHAIVAAKWAIPALQTVHILAVAVVFSSAMLVNLRVFRLFERDEPPSAVVRRFVPVIWPVLAILFVTGSLLIVAEPRRALINPTFYLKMTLLTAAIGVTVGLQATLLGAAGKDLRDGAAKDAAERDRAAPLTGRALATVSILLWCGILFAGRFIAYTQGG